MSKISVHAIITSDEAGGEDIVLTIKSGANAARIAREMDSLKYELLQWLTGFSEGLQGVSMSCHPIPATHDDDG